MWGTPWSRIRRPVRRCQKNELSESRLRPARQPPRANTVAKSAAMDGRTAALVRSATGRRLRARLSALDDPPACAAPPAR